MAGDQPSEHVCGIRVRIDANEFARLDERGENGPMLSIAVRTSEQRVLATESDRMDGALDDIGVDLDPPVIGKRAPGPANA